MIQERLSAVSPGGNRIRSCPLRRDSNPRPPAWQVGAARAACGL